MEEIHAKVSKTHVGKTKFLLQEVSKQRKEFDKAKSNLKKMCGNDPATRKECERLRKIIENRSNRFMRLDTLPYEDRFYSFLKELDRSNLPHYQTLSYLDLSIPTRRNRTFTIDCKMIVNEPIKTFLQHRSKILQPDTSSKQHDIFNQCDNSSQQSDTSFEQPGTSFQQPDTSFEQTGTSFQQPATSFEQPGTPFQQIDNPFQHLSDSFQEPSTSLQQNITNCSLLDLISLHKQPLKYIKLTSSKQADKSSQNPVMVVDLSSSQNSGSTSQQSDASSQKPVMVIDLTSIQKKSNPKKRNEQTSKEAGTPFKKPVKPSRKNFNSKKLKLADGSYSLNKSSLMVHFNIYQPNKPYVKGERNPSKPRFSQELILHGYNTLADLRDAIVCENDLCRSIIPPHKMCKEVLPSGCFYINNAFYIDMRKPENIDYSASVKAWGKSKGLNLGETYLMEATHIIDLTVIENYPYLYKHVGDCEHFVVVNKLRFYNDSDPTYVGNYPFLHIIRTSNPEYCRSCGRHPVQCVVTNSTRALVDPFKCCKRCYESFFLFNGQEIEPQINCYSKVDRSVWI